VGWQAESIVFLILAPSGDVDAYQAFRTLTGEAPTHLSQLPPVQPGSVAAGLYNDYQLQVISRPGRVELAISVPPGPENEKGLIEDPQAAVGALAELAKLALGLLPAHRLSFIATLGRITNTVEEAKSLFFKELGIKEIAAVPTDLLFQYNDPTETRRGRVLNRITKWGVASVTVFQIQGAVQIPLATPVSPTQSQEQYHTLQMTTDVNISPSASPIDLDEAADVISDLARQTENLISEANESHS
jgi:hypothetical protein